MWYCYCRKSTDKQNETSFEVQEEYLKGQAQKLGETEVQVVTETGSGSSVEGRPEFKRILEESKTGDVIALYDSSRGFRNTEDALRTATLLNIKGVRLFISDKFFDISSPIDKMLFSISSSFDSYQREIQTVKSREGIRQVYDSGDYVFCSTLFGYELTRRGKTKIVTVIEEEAKIIRFVFEKFSSGWSVKKILQELQGLPLNRQSNFTLKKISRILKQTIYMGYYIKDRTKVEDLSRCTRNVLEGLLVHSNYYTPIVSEELFWDCWERYREVRPTHSRPWELRWTKHTLSGIIRCEKCGKGISRFTKRGGLYAVEDHTPDCPSKNRVKFQEDWLERIMEICFVLVFLDGSEISSFFSAKQQELFSDETEIVQAIESIDKSIEETNTKIDRIVSAIANGIFTNEQASSQMKGLKQTISDYENRRKSLESDLLSVNEDLDTFIELSAEEILNDFHGDKKRDLYKKFIKYAYAYNDRIEVEYLNGKHYTIPRGHRHNHKVDPVTVKVSYNDNEYIYKNDEYSFVYEVNKVVYNPCGVEVYDKFVQSLLDRAWSSVIEST